LANEANRDDEADDDDNDALDGDVNDEEEEAIDDDEDDKGDVLIVVGSLKVFTSKLKSFDKRLLTVVSFVFSFN